MSKISLIISREYNQRVRKRTFIITTILMPVLMVFMVMVPMLVMSLGGEQAREIVVVDQSGVIASKLKASPMVRYVISGDSLYENSVDKAEYDDSYGFLVVGSDVVYNPKNLSLYTRKSSTLTLEKEITDQVAQLVEDIRVERSGVAALDSLMREVKAESALKSYEIGDNNATSQSSSGASMVIAYICGLIIYMFIFMYGAMVMNGVVEEKSNRIIEVMVSSVKPFELMMGKIIGIAFVALTQVAIWVVLLVVGISFLQGVVIDPNVASQVVAQGATGMNTQGMSGMVQNLDPEMLGAISTIFNPGYMFGILGGFIIFFAGGYLLYAAMFAAIGSAVDNINDTQQLQLPVTIPLLASLIIMMNVMNDPHSPLAFWCSIIPFTSPIIMVARLPYGVPLWEIILSVSLLYITFIGMTYFAAKIYRTGIFMYGKKPSLKEIIRWSRYK